MIYFAWAEGTDLIKIGYSGDHPAVRVRLLQTGCPYHLVLLTFVDGEVADEIEWHKKFDADRVQGEWFRITPPLLIGIIQARCGLPSPPPLPLTVSLTETARWIIRELAHRRGVSQSALVEQMIREKARGDPDPVFIRLFEEAKSKQEQER